MPVQDSDLTQYIITILISILGTSGIGSIIGYVIYNYIKLQIEEGNASLEDREIMRKSQLELVGIISNLNQGINQRNEIQRIGEEKHIEALEKLVLVIDNMSTIASGERASIKTDTESILGTLDRVDINVQEIIEQLRDKLENGN